MKVLNILLSSLIAALLTLPAVAQLSGTYTVGGSAPDHGTLTAAVNALNSQGATGNVVFDIRPGTYTGQYAIAEISGTPGNITFRRSGMGAVNLYYDANDENDNYIFQVDGTDGVKFEGLTFHPLDEYYATSISFFNACEGVEVSNCAFYGSTVAIGPGHLHQIAIHCNQLNASTTDNPQNVHITNNAFMNGYSGIDLYFHWAGVGRCEGLIISNNEFLDQHGTGISVTRAVGEISDNVLRSSNTEFYVGIRTATLDGGSQILRNRVEVNTALDCTGIEVSNTQSTTDNIVANNMVYVRSGTVAWGLIGFNIWGVQFLNNSIEVADGEPENSFAYYHLGNGADGQDGVLRNNIFSNHSGGPAIKVNVAGNLATEDHNDLFSTGTALTNIGEIEYANLAAHQAGTGQGSGDISIDPVFPAQPDLEMNNCAMDNMGQYSAAAGVDVNGDPHGNPVCDLGADEFTANNNDVQAPMIMVQSSDLPYQLGLNATFTNYAWNTGATTPTISITAGGNYSCDVTDVNGCSYTINTVVDVNINTAVTTTTNTTVQLFPNPASVAITLTGVSPATAYNVCDAAGRVVLEGTTLNDRAQVDVSQLKTGLYTLHTQNRKGQQVAARFVKQ